MTVFALHENCFRLIRQICRLTENCAHLRPRIRIYFIAVQSEKAQEIREEALSSITQSVSTFGIDVNAHTACPQITIKTTKTFITLRSQLLRCTEEKTLGAANPEGAFQSSTILFALEHFLKSPLLRSLFKNIIFKGEI